MDRIFNIDSGNGSIFTSKTLDRESLLWHNITVIASEISKLLMNIIAVTNASFKLRVSKRTSGPMLWLLVFNQGHKPETSSVSFLAFFPKAADCEQGSCA